MRKLIIAISLLFASTAVNAIPVYLVSHTADTDGGGFQFYRNDGTHSTNGGTPTTGTWDWDGTTLTLTGTYNAVLVAAGGPNPSIFAPSLFEDTITNLTINTATQSAAGTTAYECTDGAFPPFVNFCGNYTIGANFIDESTLTYGPGLSVSCMLGGDDVDAVTGMMGIPCTDPRTIASYNFGFESFDGTTLVIGDGLPPGTAGSQQMIFTTVVPVPAAVWLFGSALGLLGWMRRRATTAT